MELASTVKKAATNVRFARMKEFAEGTLQKTINEAKLQGLETANGDVPLDVDMGLLKSYIAEFAWLFFFFINAITPSKISQRLY